VCLAAGLSYFGIRSSQSSSGGIQNSSPVAKILPRAVTAMPKAPLRIFSGTIYRLTGVTNISGRTMAVINDDIVSVGDSLSGNAVVKAIGAGEVLLDVQGKEIKLTL
ncbi:MAG: hypothetical protein HY767_03600, partial [Candidatus Omnitrophica bacterium]|nr:hypothetical protein [Candidatus Omnitrophota bacterium]